MLVRFKSTATESITMFGEVAVQLIKMLGATGAVPGAISAEDIPDALNRLQQSLQRQLPQDVNQENETNADDQEDKQPSVSLVKRAGPLIDVLTRAAAADAPVMWEKLG